MSERNKLTIYFILTVVMSGLVYPTLVAAAWNNGILFQIGYQDFAGAGIVHLSAGIAGLIGASASGPRKNRFKD